VFRYLISGFVTAALLVGVAAGYPSTGQYKLNLNEGQYTGMCNHKHRSVGDIIYYDALDRPAWSSLTFTEKLMVAGEAPNPRPKGTLSPYYAYVRDAAVAYYREFGVLPTALDLQTLVKIPHFSKRSPEMKRANMEELRNPLTGRWPRLDAKEHSPGDFYMKVLTKEEMSKIKQDPEITKLWTSGKTHEGEPVNATIVVYLRMYGHKGPLYANDFTVQY
jgi:hypothetical protein